MGLGDEIIVTALVKKLYRTTGKPTAIINSKNLLRWSAVWENNPYILNKKDTLGDRKLFPNLPNDSYNVLASGNGGNRPYIDYEKSRHHQYYKWKEWDIEPGEIFLSEKELETGRGFNDYFSAFGEHPVVIIEPTIKGHLQSNKDWGINNWIKLVQLLNKHKIFPVQLEHFYSNIKLTPHPYEVHSIREMFACLSGADMIISHEGGMHHAAAALGIKGIVIFGGYISPKITGYPIHTNLVGHDIEPQVSDYFCGNLIPCNHCHIAMNSILPEKVCYETLKILEKKYG